MERPALLIGGAAILGAAYLLWQWNPGASADTQTDNADATDAPPAPTSWVEDAMNSVASVFTGWRPPAQYAGTIAQAEDDNGIPRDILARLLYQECRWRADVISGAKRSRVGALGIAQFMPATAAELGVNPLDPVDAINGAARYLARLYRATGQWSLALASYNWGLGNVQRKGLSAAPAETRNYYSQILADVNSADGTAYA